MAWTRELKSETVKAFPTALGALGGGVAAGIATGFVRKVGPLSKPGVAYDWVAPVVGAAVASAAGFALASSVKPLRSARTGVLVGGLVALLTLVGAKLGVRGFQTNTGTAGVGILVAEETAALEAIVAESDTDGVALAALDDGTLAEIVAEGAEGVGAHGDNYEGAFAALEQMVDVDSGGVGDDDDDYGGVGAGGGVAVDSGGVGAPPAFFGQNSWSGF